MNGKWLKPKAESEDDSEKNPFEAAGMDGAMEGMKKQAVMMYVHLRLHLALHYVPHCVFMLRACLPLRGWN